MFSTPVTGSPSASPTEQKAINGLYGRAGRLGLLTLPINRVAPYREVAFVLSRQREATGGWPWRQRLDRQTN
jgi:hypothetical protein